MLDDLFLSINEHVSEYISFRRQLLEIRLKMLLNLRFVRDKFVENVRSSMRGDSAILNAFRVAFSIVSSLFHLYLSRRWCENNLLLLVLCGNPMKHQANANVRVWRWEIENHMSMIDEVYRWASCIEQTKWFSALLGKRERKKFQAEIMSNNMLILVRVEIRSEKPRCRLVHTLEYWMEIYPLACLSLFMRNILILINLFRVFIPLDSSSFLYLHAPILTSVFMSPAVNACWYDDGNVWPIPCCLYTVYLQGISFLFGSRPTSWTLPVNMALRRHDFVSGR